jgi:hypothetical protein
MRKDPAPLPFLQEALTIAKFEPGMYEVVESFVPMGARAPDAPYDEMICAHHSRAGGPRGNESS